MYKAACMLHKNQTRHAGRHADDGDIQQDAGAAASLRYFLHMDIAAIVTAATSGRHEKNRCDMPFGFLVRIIAAATVALATVFDVARTHNSEAPQQHSEVAAAQTWSAGAGAVSFAILISPP